MPEYHMPIDQECPDVEEFADTLWNDPMTAYSGVGDEIWEDFERKHRANCPRCQEFGAENIEVI